jgi:hypothetical protein
MSISNFRPYGEVTCFTEYPEFKDITRLHTVVNINNSEAEHQDLAPLLTNFYIIYIYIYILTYN